MSGTTSPFGTELDQAVQHISKRRRWKRRDVYEDIGHELAVSGRTVESWKYKTLPDQGKLEKLARYLFTHGRDLCNRPWLQNFLVLGGHERPAALLNELFPIVGPAPRPAVAPPVATQPNIRWQVADARPDFMGREAEMMQLAAAVDAGKRLFVIHGMAGVGRLTLASEYAQAHRADFQGGAAAVSVAPPSTAAGGYPTRDDQLLEALETLADSLRIDLSDPAAPADSDVTPKKQLDKQSQRFKDKMAERTPRTLLIVEDILGREECDYFLPPRPGDHILIVTSPSRDTGMNVDLNIHLKPFTEEHLPVAVELLAKVIGSDIVNHVADADALTDIATYVDGLPFALWFTGERIKADRLVDGSLTLAEYNDVILHLQDDRFTTLEERVQELLRATYALLPEPLQRCLAVLAVFEGREFSYKAAEAAMTEDDQLPMVNWSRDLMKYSLLEFNRRGRRMVDSQPTPRLSLHSLVRRLASYYFSVDFSAQEQQAIRDRAAWFHIDLAAEVAEQFADGRRHDFAPLTIEWPNIQAAMSHFAQQRNAYEFHRGLIALTRPSLGALGFLEVTGRWSKANEWLKEAYLLATREGDTEILPQLHFIAGVFAMRQGDLSLARERLQDSVNDLAALPNQSVEQRLLLGQVHQYLGEVLTKLNDLKGALTTLDESERILSELATPAAVYERGYTDIRRGQPLFQTGQDAVTIMLRGLAALPQYPRAAHVSGALTLGTIHNYSNQPDEAIAAWNTGLPHAEALGDVRRTADLRRNQTNVQAEFGQLANAVTAQTEWYEKYEEMGDAAGAGEAASNLGLAYLGLKQYDESRRWLDKAVAIGQRHGLENVDTHAAINLTRWHIQQGNYAAAAATLQLVENVPFQRSEARQLRAEIALHEGQGEDALAAAHEAIGAIRSRADAGSGHRVKAAILSHLNRADEAGEAYDQALSIFAGNPYETALTQLSRAAHLRRAGDEPGAVALEQEAAAALAELGLEPPDVVL